MNDVESLIRQAQILDWMAQLSRENSGAYHPSEYSMHRKRAFEIRRNARNSEEKDTGEY